MALTTKVLLNKVRQKADETYPLAIRVTYNRKVIYIPLGYSLKEKDFDANNQRVKQSSKITNNITRLNNQIQGKVRDVYATITALEDDDRIATMSMKEIKQHILGVESDQKNLSVFQFIDEEIESLNTAQKQGSATVYKALRNKLLTLSRNEDFGFAQLNYKFLKKLEEKHYELGLKPGGLAVYMRTLKAIYNKAVKLGHAKKEDYPFGDYKIKQGKPVRKALSQADFDAFVSHEFEVGSVSDRVKKLFMASFYLRGANWMDMAFMTWENVQGDLERITYVRRKTGEPFNIKVHPNLKDIIVDFSKREPTKTDYLFPILDNKKPHINEISRIRDSRNNLNRRLKTIADLIGIEPFSIYAARHTYATTAKRKGVPTAVIQEGMGHSTETITQTYLDSFENTVVDEYDDLIMG